MQITPPPVVNLQNPGNITCGGLPPQPACNSEFKSRRFFATACPGLAEAAKASEGGRGLELPRAALPPQPRPASCGPRPRGAPHPRRARPGPAPRLAAPSAAASAAPRGPGTEVPACGSRGARGRRDVSGRAVAGSGC